MRKWFGKQVEKMGANSNSENKVESTLGKKNEENQRHKKRWNLKSRVMQYAAAFVMSFAIFGGTLGIEAASSGNKTQTIYDGGYAFTVQADFNMSVKRSGGNINVTINGHMNVPNGCWEAIEMWVNDSHVGGRSVTLAGQGSAWPKEGRGSTTFSFADNNAGTVSGQVYFGFKGRAANGVRFDYSVNYSAGYVEVNSQTAYFNANGGTLRGPTSIRRPAGHQLAYSNGYWNSSSKNGNPINMGHANRNFGNKISYVAKFSYNDASGAKCIVGNWQNGGGGLHTREGKINFQLYINGAYHNAAGPAPTIGQTYWAVGTYDGSKMRLYINGSLYSSTSVSGTIGVSNQPLMIGANPDGTKNSGHFNGKIYKAGVYSGTLSASEISTLCNNGNFGAIGTQPLAVGGWSVETPTRSGYTFDGWYTAASGGSKISGSTTMPSGGATYYAHWRQNTGHLDVNGVVDGKLIGSGLPAKFDVYVNGVKVGTDVNDFGYNVPIGQKWEIKNVRPNSGYKYLTGTGATSGTMTASGSSPNLHFQKENYISYDLQGGSINKNISNPNGYKIVDNGYYTINSVINTNKFIHISNMSLANSSPIVIYDGGGSAYQTVWYFERYQDTPYYYIINKYSGKALNLYGDINHVTNTSAIEQYDQLDGGVDSDFLWYLKDQGNGYVSILNKKTGYAIDLPDGNVTNGTVLRQWAPNNANAQKFRLNAVETGQYPKKRKVVTGRFVVNSSVPVKPGYTFKGWNTRANGIGDWFQPGQELKTDVTVTLYAQWEANAYDIEYDPKGGTMPSSYPKTYTTDKGAKLPVPTKKGYNFKGWREVEIWRLNYELNGGTLKGDAPKYCIKGESVETLPTATKTGHTFKGWSKDKAGIQMVKAPLALKADTTLYAQWSPNTYTITYKANGGTGADQTQKVTYGSSWTTKGAIFSRKDHTFESWNTQADGKGTRYSLSTAQTDKQLSNVTLYAQWKEKDWDVTIQPEMTKMFSGDRYEGDTQQVGYSISRTLESNYSVSYSSSGSDIASVDKTGKVKANRPGVVNIIVTVTTEYGTKRSDSFKLTVVEGDEFYPIGWDANGGTMPSNSPELYYVKAGLSSFPTPTRKGYTFKGWKDLDSGKIVTSIPKETRGGKAFEAQWEAIKKTYELVNGGRFNDQMKAVDDKNSIKTIEFVDAKMPTNGVTEITGLDADDDGGIVGWYTVDADGFAHVKVSSQRPGQLMWANEDSSGMFKDLGYVESIEFGEFFETENVTDMHEMFAMIGQDTKTFVLSGLNRWSTSDVMDMSSMFMGAGYYATIWDIGDISGWDTRKVENMSSMFEGAGYEATTWEIGDLHHWDTCNVTDMNNMFDNAGLQAKTWSIGNLSDWDTSQVTDMSFMFSSVGANATTFDIGDLSGWDTSSVTDMSHMFYHAGLKVTTWEIGDLSNWDTSSVTNMSSMFDSAGLMATTWEIGDLSNWDTRKVENMSYMFQGFGQNVINHHETGIHIMNPNTKISSMFSSAFTKGTIEFTVDYADGCRDVAKKAVETKSNTANVHLSDYEVTFDANDNTNAKIKILIDYNSISNTINTPTRAGYKFTGWWTAPTGGEKVGGIVGKAINYSELFKPLNKDCTVYAQWKKETANISSGNNRSQASVSQATAAQVAQAYGMGLKSPLSVGGREKVAANRKTDGTVKENREKENENRKEKVNGAKKKVENPMVELGKNIKEIVGKMIAGVGEFFEGKNEQTMFAQENRERALIEPNDTFDKTVNHGKFDTSNASKKQVVSANDKRSSATMAMRRCSTGAAPGSLSGPSKTESEGSYSEPVRQGMHAVKETVGTWIGSVVDAMNTPIFAAEKDADADGSNSKKKASSKDARKVGDLVKEIPVGEYGDKFYIAEWELAERMVTYKANGGAGEDVQQKVEYAKPWTTKGAIFSRTGYRLTSWNTQADGKGKSYGLSANVDGISENLTLYAQWTPNTYKIHYDGNGNTVKYPGDVAQMKDSSHTYDVAKKLSKNEYTRIGWDFVGWNTAKDGSGKAYKDEESVKNLTETHNGTVTLYAQWEPKGFMVVFHPNGGTTPQPFSEKEGEQGQPIGELPTTTRKGYTFKGWYDTETLTENSAQATENTVLLIKLTELWAQWEKETYSISYDYNGGTVQDNPESYSVDTPTITLKNPTRAGYLFTGWTGSNGDTPQTTVTIPKGSTGDQSYVANWKPITYTIRYNGNGATSGTMSDSSHTYDVAKALTQNKYVRKNAKFIGWNTKADGSGTSYDDMQSVDNLTTQNGAVITLYAQWEKTKVVVHFDSQGGSKVADINGYAGDPIGELPIPTREGYTFDGWWTHPGTGSPISETTPLPADETTYYAHWIANGYTITYDLDGGKVSGNPNTYKPTDKDITLKNPTKVGYDFVGWVGTDISSPSQTVVIKTGSMGNRRYEAIWKAHTYTIAYHGNGSTSGSMSSSRHTYDVAKNLTKNGFSRTGYDFVGWNTKADGRGVAYKNSQSVKNLTSTNGATVTLYAQWKIKQYKVTFDPNMDASSNTVTIYAGTREETLKRPNGSVYREQTGGTKTKYILTFHEADPVKGLLSVRIKGLFPAFDGSIRKVESTKTSIVDFDPTTITKVVKFDANGGTCDIESARFTINTSLATLPVPVREGYKFDGWYTEPDGGTKVTTSTPLGNKDMTLYAHWTAKTYTITYRGNNGVMDDGNDSFKEEAVWGSNYAVSSNPFVREGYTFKGWNTKSDGSGKDYTHRIDKEEEWKEDRDVILYAIWKQK